uniref:Uncharacterized protein n=1 Tax=Timema monikensis TaxID=170555 RepID=A0A7R9EGB2_9NEOP|nr:unnamed protein product [Timema monikensis]
MDDLGVLVFNPFSVACGAGDSRHPRSNHLALHDSSHAIPLEFEMEPPAQIRPTPRLQDFLKFMMRITHGNNHALLPSLCGPNSLDHQILGTQHLTVANLHCSATSSDRAQTTNPPSRAVQPYASDVWSITLSRRQLFLSPLAQTDPDDGVICYAETCRSNFKLIHTSLRKRNKGTQIR